MGWQHPVKLRALLWKGRVIHVGAGREGESPKTATRTAQPEAWRQVLWPPRALRLP